jgi:hypothetical protein
MSVRFLTLALLMEGQDHDEMTGAGTSVRPELRSTSRATFRR